MVVRCSKLPTDFNSLLLRSLSYALTNKQNEKEEEKNLVNMSQRCIAEEPSGEAFEIILWLNLLVD